MAISPNTTFVSGAVYTAAQANAYGFSTMQLATSTTTYVLTGSDATATGMSVSFTALANRNYKITYYEPEIKMTNTGLIILTIRRTSGTPAQLQGATISSPTSSGANYASATVTYVGTFSAGTVTLTGTASTTNTGATPQLDRSATLVATLLVEDIGPA